ncbi:hypothetical protein GYMLUDRAFT_258504 [Collybiopsis luxurians FD-317 M1]|nr:hypothetical protein GYMLUDRAFT_258504 [Collybiopsis luxurians FD-317 M1]
MDQPESKQGEDSKQESAGFSTSSTVAVRDEDEGRRQVRKWALVVLIIAVNLATFMAALDNTIVATAIPTITSQFHSISDVGWYGSIYMLSMTPLQPTFGKVYKMFSVKYVYISSLIIFEVGSIIGASAPNSFTLIVGRAVSGVGAAAIFVGGMAIVMNAVPKNQHALHISLLQSMFGSANTTGPLLGTLISILWILPLVHKILLKGGVFTDLLSWRWCFWINVPFGFLIAFIVFCCYDERNDPQETPRPIKERIRQLDIPGSILLVASVICLLLALQWGGTTYSWRSARIICLVVFSAVLFCGFGFVQYMRPQHAIIPFPVIAKRLVFANAFYVFFLTVGRFVHMYYLPFYFQTCRGASPIGSGLRFLPYSITATLSTIILGVFINQTGLFSPVQLFGAILFTIGSGLVAIFRIDTSAGRWIGYQIVAGTGAGASVQTPYIGAQAAVGPGEVHTANAIIMFMTALGGAISVSVAQNILTTGLIHEIPKYTGEQINGTDVLTLGATGLHDSSGGIPPDQLEGVLKAFVYALDRTFIVPIVAGSLCVMLALVGLHRGQPKMNVKESSGGTCNSHTLDDESTDTRNPQGTINDKQ